jgi:hypothetical protein
MSKLHKFYPTVKMGRKRTKPSSETPPEHPAQEDDSGSDFAPLRLEKPRPNEEGSNMVQRIM